MIEYSIIFKEVMAKNNHCLWHSSSPHNVHGHRDLAKGCHCLTMHHNDAIPLIRDIKRQTALDI